MILPSVILYNLISIIMTLIVFDLIYSKFSERCPTSCLGIATTPLAFAKRVTRIPPPSTDSNSPLPLIKKFEKFQHPHLLDIQEYTYSSTVNKVDIRTTLTSFGPLFLLTLNRFHTLPWCFYCSL